MANEFEVNDEVGKKKLTRRLIGFYPENLRAIDTLIKTNKFGRTASDVIRAAVAYLLEKEGKQ